VALGKTTDKVPVTTYLLRAQHEQLQAISVATDAPVAALIRRAVREFLERRMRRRSLTEAASSEPKIVTAYAALDDAAAMGALLAPIKGGDKLRAMLLARKGKPCRTQSYDAETRVARFIASNGARVACYAVTGISAAQAAEIAAAWTDLREVSTKLFTELAAGVLDVPMISAS
jgi:hypothetical protein